MGVDQVLRSAGVDTNDPRVSLLLALASQSARSTEKNLGSVALEAAKYLNPRRSDAQNLEEALMTVPDLETIPSRVVSREEGYEIREVEDYLIAETEMQSGTGFDFLGSSQAFNTLAGYLFGDNTRREEMEMTTPVISRREGGKGEEMEMTTPVLSSQVNGKWKMSFVMSSKFKEETLPLPKNKKVSIKKVPAKTVAVVTFSGLVSDSEVGRREEILRKKLRKNLIFRAKSGAQIEVAQYNPPFTPPFARRNEISLELEKVNSLSETVV